MSGAGTFTVVNDETFCVAIEATQQSLVYVAPGVTKPVVEAIGASLRRKPHLQVTATIDLDPEVYRISAKRVNIPNDLLVGEEKAFKERLKNSLLLLQGEQTIRLRVAVLSDIEERAGSCKVGLQRPEETRH